MLSSKRVKRYLVPSGSQPLGNTKKDKIQRTPSSTQKNKVEAYPRTVKSSLRNKNCFVEPKGTVNVQHSKLNANSEPLCVKCNEKFKEKSLETKGNCSQILDTPGDLLEKPTSLESDISLAVVTLVYLRKPKKSNSIDSVVPSSSFEYAGRLHIVLCENLGKLQPKADIDIFIGYAPTKKSFRIYNRRTRRIIEAIHVDFDELTVMASEHSNSRLTLYEMTPVTISLRLMPNPPPSTPFVPPSRIAPVPALSTGSPSSTNVDQDEPSPSYSQTTPETQPPIIPNDVKEDNHDIEVDHPLDNIICELKRPVSTRLQLHEQALFCYYDAFLSSVEVKTYKYALTQLCWIEVMQEELNEFECLKVWELVPRPYKVMVITLKWIYKVKLDELGGIQKNKARLIAYG
ncbi:retrovirus-related pol polyprotein from transposon TNT 1-94 [Tanacetum coccineum]